MENPICITGTALGIASVPRMVCARVSALVVLERQVGSKLSVVRSLPMTRTFTERKKHSERWHTITLMETG